MATGQEGRAPRTAPFQCPSPTKHDSAEIHFTPPPRTQTTGNLAWVKDFLLERGWWNLAASGLALPLCAKRAVGEGQVSPNVCPADPSEMWSKLLLARGVKLQGTREDRSEQNQKNSALLPASPLANCLHSIPYDCQEPDLRTGAPRPRSCCPGPPPQFLQVCPEQPSPEESLGSAQLCPLTPPSH